MWTFFIAALTFLVGLLLGAKYQIGVQKTRLAFEAAANEEARVIYEAAKTRMAKKKAPAAKS